MTFCCGYCCTHTITVNLWLLLLIVWRSICVPAVIIISFLHVCNVFKQTVVQHLVLVLVFVWMLIFTAETNKTWDTDAVRCVVCTFTAGMWTDQVSCYWRFVLSSSSSPCWPFCTTRLESLEPPGGAGWHNTMTNEVGQRDLKRLVKTHKREPKTKIIRVSLIYKRISGCFSAQMLQYNVLNNLMIYSLFQSENSSRHELHH